MDEASAGSGEELLSRRVRAVAGELAILAVIWAVLWFGFRIWFSPVLVGGVAAAIALPLVAPARWEWIASAAGWLGLAALAYFYFGNAPMAAVLAVVGVLIVGSGLARRQGR